MTITKEGALASFYTVNKAPIKHLRVYFSPKLTGEGDPSPENIRPISGWDEILIEQASKNLLPTGTFTRTTAGGVTFTYNNDGSIHIESTNGMTSGYGFIDLPDTFQFYLSAGTYKISGSPSPYIIIYLLLEGRDIEFKISNGSIKTEALNGGIAKLLIAVTNASTLNTIIYPQLTIESEDNTYMKPKHNNYNITFSSTIYGGYVDLITGELVLQYDMYSAPWKDWSSSTDLGNNTRKAKTIPYTPVGGNASTTSLCNLTNNYLWSNSDDSIHFYVANSSNTVYAILPNSLDENLEVLISYKLKNPITYQLTPLQLKTFIGRNNIWSNADRVEVEYDLVETNEELYKRRNIILNSAPHIETASGAIATFNTDMTAPLKECKINFLPILEGTGDPSPDNVRNINGWTRLSINHTGKNLLDPSIAFATQGGADPTKHVNSDGSVTVTARDGTSWTARGYLDLPPGTYYFYSEFGSGYSSRYIMNDIVSEVNFSGKKTVTITEPTRFRFKAAMGTEYPITGWILVFAANDTYGEYPYINNTLNITWTSNGTVYGGYVDLITGKIYSKYSKLNLSNITWYNFSGHKVHYASILARPANGLIYCNMLTPKTNTITPGQTGIGYYTRDNERNRLYVLKDEAVTNDTEFRTWFAETYPDAYIIYELETPQLIATLTPQQLTAFKGVNNIWSDANGPISVQYWTH